MNNSLSRKVFYMDESRVYSKKIDINTDHTKDFYNDRAKKADSMNCPYTAVLLGDQAGDRARQWDSFEKSFLLSEVGFDKNDRVLDIGCGMGRLAETLIPLCGYYYGADFSSEMIKLAEKRCADFDHDRFEFHAASFNDIVKNPDIVKNKANKVVITGVCMYINDSDLHECYEGLLDCVSDDCLLYIEDTVGVKERLTLNNIESEALQSNYDAIYRSPKEYNELFEIFTNKGFRIVKQDFFPNFDGDSSFKETDHWFTILTNKK